jgi:uncharacterized coiled-coil DUF342 family protein
VDSAESQAALTRARAALTNQERQERADVTVDATIVEPIDGDTKCGTCDHKRIVHDVDDGPCDERQCLCKGWERPRADVTSEARQENPKPQATDLIDCPKCKRRHAAYIQSCAVEGSTVADSWGSPAPVAPARGVIAEHVAALEALIVISQHGPTLEINAEHGAGDWQRVARTGLRLRTLLATPATPVAEVVAAAEALSVAVFAATPEDNIQPERERLDAALARFRASPDALSTPFDADVIAELRRKRDALAAEVAALKAEREEFERKAMEKANRYLARDLEGQGAREEALEWELAALKAVRLLCARCGAGGILLPEGAHGAGKTLASAGVERLADTLTADLATARADLKEARNALLTEGVAHEETKRDRHSKELSVVEWIETARALRAERDAAVKRADQAEATCALLGQNVDAAYRERDAARVERDHAVVARNAAVRAREAVQDLAARVAALEAWRRAGGA